MKKLLLSLAAVCSAFVMNAAAITVYDSTSPETWTKSGDNFYFEKTIDGQKFKVTLAKDGSSNALRDPVDAVFRVYKNASFTVESSTTNMTQVVVTYDGSTSYQGDCAITPNTWSGSRAGATYTLTNASGGNTVTLKATNNQVRVKKIEVTIPDAPEKAVKTPTFSLVKTAEGYAVEMSCATEGAQIYYTTSWDEAPADPTNASQAYSAPIDVWGMTYFKAIAYKGEEFSNVASYTANPPMVVEDFSNLVGAGFEEGQEALIEYRGNATVVYQNGSNIYVTDGNTGMCLYGSNSSTYSNGDVINGITGTYTVYKGLPEIKNYTLGEVTTGGAAVQPKEVELYLVNNSMINRYVKLVGVNIAEGTSANNYVLSNADGDEVALYNQFKINMETGENFTVTGIIGSFNNVQFMPITIEGGTVMETVATPVFEPASGELEANAEITITCATEGAAIYYTVDGTTPTADSNEYLAPIVFTKAMTVKAIAVKDGMLDSEIAEAVYTLKVEDPEQPKPGTVTFDFKNAVNGEIYGVTAPTSADPTYLCEKGGSWSCSESPIEMTVSFTGSNDSQRPRLHLNKEMVGLRAYANTAITFTADSKYMITAIEFEQNAGSTDWNATFDPVSGATIRAAAQTWTSSTTGGVQKVTLNCTGKTFFSQAKVSYIIAAGVEGVEVEEDAAPVYYNLQGVRVNNPERGIYIQVKGNKATKVVL